MFLDFLRYPAKRGMNGYAYATAKTKSTEMKQLNKTKIIWSDAIRVVIEKLERKGYIPAPY